MMTFGEMEELEPEREDVVQKWLSANRYDIADWVYDFIRCPGYKLVAYSFLDGSIYYFKVKLKGHD